MLPIESQNPEPPAPLTLLLVCAEHPRLPAVLDQLRAQGALVAWSEKSDKALQWLSTLTPDLMLISSALKGAVAPAVSGHTKVLIWDGHPEQLAAQLQPYLPKARPTEGPQCFGDLELDPNTGWVQHHSGRGQVLRVHMPATELRLLLCLARQQGRAMSRIELLQAAWSSAETPQARSVDQVVRRLRPLLAQVGLPDALRSLRGLGYRLDLSAANPSLPAVDRSDYPLV
jgi:DNA-binding winged helix-turn-helix (wHTH) protein